MDADVLNALSSARGDCLAAQRWDSCKKLNRAQRIEEISHQSESQALCPLF